MLFLKRYGFLAGRKKRKKKGKAQYIVSTHSSIRAFYPSLMRCRLWKAQRLMSTVPAVRVPLLALARRWREDHTTELPSAPGCAVARSGPLMEGGPHHGNAAISSGMPLPGPDRCVDSQVAAVPYRAHCAPKPRLHQHVNGP